MKLRNHTFFSIEELNEEIGKLLDLYNKKRVKRLNKSRQEMFEILDKTFLQPLPANSYSYKEFKSATVGVDYHIELEGSGYSVPYTYLGKKVEVIYSRTAVMIRYNGIVIAHHPRMSQPWQDSTLKEHMPSSHRYQHEKWNPRRILNWANTIGVNTTTLIEKIMQSKAHPTRGYRSCMAILNFSKIYSKAEMEMAAEVALEYNRIKVSSIESMLKTKSYLAYYQNQTANKPHNFLNHHDNIRGSDYYSGEEVQS